MRAIMGKALQLSHAGNSLRYRPDSERQGREKVGNETLCSAPFGMYSYDNRPGSSTQNY